MIRFAELYDDHQILEMIKTYKNYVVQYKLSEIHQMIFSNQLIVKSVDDVIVAVVRLTNAIDSSKILGDVPNMGPVFVYDGGGIFLQTKQQDDVPNLAEVYYMGMLMLQPRYVGKSVSREIITEMLKWRLSGVNNFIIHTGSTNTEFLAKLIFDILQDIYRTDYLYCKIYDIKFPGSEAVKAIGWKIWNCKRPKL